MKTISIQFKSKYGSGVAQCQQFEDIQDVVMEVKSRKEILEMLNRSLKRQAVLREIKRKQKAWTKERGLR